MNSDKNYSYWLLSIFVFVVPFYLYFYVPNHENSIQLIGFLAYFIFPIALLITIITGFLIYFALSNIKNNVIQSVLILLSTVPMLILIGVVLQYFFWK